MNQPYSIELREVLEEPLNKIWQEHSDYDHASIPPLFVADMPKNAIIFIGINPSLAEKDRKELLERERRTADHYRHTQDRDSTHSYFHKFIDISEHTGVPWGHLDLLYIRETSQKKIESLIRTEEGLDFIWSQLMLSKQVIDLIIEQAEPRAFLVANTLSRRFLGLDKAEDHNMWMDYDFEWNDDIGTYLLGDIPFFFSSMLTGQRAMDNESFKRLRWHIDAVVKNKLKSK